MRMLLMQVKQSSAENNKKFKENTLDFKGLNNTFSRLEKDLAKSKKPDYKVMGTSALNELRLAARKLWKR